LAEKQDKRS